jgi:hypothetical protein
LGRAKQHLESAKAISDAFLKSKFHVLMPYENSKGRLTIRVEEIKPYPPEMALLIGDAAHNLRCALDHLAFAFAKPANAKEEKAVQFPIVSKRRDFRGEANRRLPGVPRRVRAAIERLQPYHGRKWPRTKMLGQLRDLSNWDKHRRIAMTVIGTPYGMISIGLPRGVKITRSKIYAGKRTFKQGTILASYQMTERLRGRDVDMYVKSFYAPVCDERMPKGLAMYPVRGGRG